MIKQRSGFMLIVFIFGLVVASFAVTTAFLAMNAVEEVNRRIVTTEKMNLCLEQIGVRQSFISNEAGTGESFLGTYHAFPASMDVFVANGYLNFFDFESTGDVLRKSDAYGHPLTMTQEASSFTISSSAGAVPDVIVPSAQYLQYTQNNITVYIEDLQGDDVPASYLNMGTSGLYSVGGAMYAAFSSSVAGIFTASNIPAGYYEIRIVQNGAGPGWSWMSGTIGTSVVSRYMIVYPGGTQKTIRFAYNVL